MKSQTNTDSEAAASPWRPEPNPCWLFFSHVPQTCRLRWARSFNTTKILMVHRVTSSIRAPATGSLRHHAPTYRLLEWHSAEGIERTKLLRFVFLGQFPNPQGNFCGNPILNLNWCVSSLLLPPKSSAAGIWTSDLRYRAHFSYIELLWSAVPSSPAAPFGFVAQICSSAHLCLYNNLDSHHTWDPPSVFTACFHLEGRNGHWAVSAIWWITFIKAQRTSRGEVTSVCVYSV